MRFIYQLTGANGLLEQLVNALYSYAVRKDLVARNKVVLLDKPCACFIIIHASVEG